MKKITNATRVKYNPKKCKKENRLINNGLAKFSVNMIHLKMFRNMFVVIRWMPISMKTKFQISCIHLTAQTRELEKNTSNNKNNRNAIDNFKQEFHFYELDNANTSVDYLSFSLGLQ